VLDERRSTLQVNIALKREASPLEYQESKNSTSSIHLQRDSCSIKYPLDPCLGKSNPRFHQPQTSNSNITLGISSQTPPFSKMASPPPPSGDTILFRPSKKRKIYRQRPDEALPSPQPASPSLTPTSPAPAQPNPQSIDELIASTASGLAAEDEELEGTPVSISEILRLRKKNKRIGGVEFRAEGHIARDEDGALVIRHAPEEGGAQSVEGESGPVIRKFAPQTGTVGDVNKHM